MTKDMKTYIKPAAATISFAPESNIMAASLIIGTTEGDQMLSREGGWSSDNWTTFDDDEAED